MNDEQKTRESLLARLKHGSDEAAWARFYHQYNGIILSFCRRQGLDDFSARDVLQETMVLLIRKLPQFDYQPERGRFRNWLLTLVAGKIRDARRRQRNHPTISLDDQASGVDGQSLSSDRDTFEALDLPWKLSLLEEVLLRIENDPHTKSGTVDVFRAFAMKREPVAEVAKRFELQENAVYQIKNRLTKRVRTEIANLLEPTFCTETQSTTEIPS